VAIAVGLIRRIKPGSVTRPELRHTGWRLTPFEAVDFYELLVPEGARVAHVPVSADSYCIVVEHQGKHYYYKIADPGSLYSRNSIIKAATATECRPPA
jgi:hypothetical protein